MAGIGEFSRNLLGIFRTVRQMVFFVMEVKTHAFKLTGIEVGPRVWMKPKRVAGVTNWQ